MNNLRPTILIIVGITGDLSTRKLLPALAEISKNEKLPDQFRIVGVTRQSNFNKGKLCKNEEDEKILKDKIDIFEMDLNEIKDYLSLKKFLFEIGEKYNLDNPQYLFYLSVPPLASSKIIELIGKSGLASDNSKLLLEKPFGVDYDSASLMLSHIDKYFDEDKVYRIDHYLAKETVQNLLVFREGNSLFKKTWNKDFINSIEINVSESIGIEGRANFYEQTGALRDLIQSHLLGLLSLTLINLDKNYSISDIGELRFKALKKVKVLKDKNKIVSVRGQYEGYKEEVNNDNSNVETFASISLSSSDKNWKGVSIKLSTGKALKEKYTEIRILYKKVRDHESNELLFRLEPNEGISFSLLTKKPGYDHDVASHTLEFNFKNHYESLPKAYEQVIYSAILGDHKFFTSGKEVLETWRIVGQVKKNWEDLGDKDLVIYKKGSEIEEIIN
ncbi:TPA: hypothetical protein DIC38_01635 [Candidatus Nomurabacteria bacterium]|nr:MAG: Glucose-6-phosphate 1-dehydrogenase [Parcubacteria bacterium RAAC4_OD1_1]HCY26363.1 hypothetical protein [Candidatus Nomurabacteria bacterium]